MTSLSILALIGAVGVAPSPIPTVAPVPTIPPATAAPDLSPTPLTSGTSAAPETPPVSPVPASPAPPIVTPAATLPPTSYGYRFVPHQPTNPAAGAPQIYAVYLNAEHLKSHGPILIRVETNGFVVKMQSKSNGRGGSIPMVAPGVFAARSVLPAIPFIASGISTDLLFIGTSADGRSVTVRVPVELG